MSRFQLSVAVMAVLAGGQLATAQDPKTPPTKPAPVAATDSADATLKDIEKTFGFVPQFMRSIPRLYLPGFWEGMKSFELNPATKLDAKTKELIGLAVAAQVPCEYCIVFHTDGARLNGATEQEIQEAVGMAAMTRNASTLLNGLQVDKAQFKKDLDRIVRTTRQQAKK